MRRRDFIATLALAASPLGAGRAQAQSDWPAGRVMRIIVPFPPGGTYDIVARLLVAPLSKALDTTVIIENKPGAGTNIATEMVARAVPDGLTLLLGGIANAINETLYPKLNFDLHKDLAGVALVASLPNVLVINPDVPAKTLAEFIALNRANPGKITFASGGIGTSPHLCAVMFGLAIGAPNTHVPYRGSAPASQDLIGGQVQAQFDSVGSALGQIKAGKLRALAVTSDHRAALLPDVPTMAEGGVPNFIVTAWMGLMAPAATPRPILDRIAGATDTVLAKPELKKILAERGYDTMSGGPEQFARYMDAEIALWRKIVKASGATVEPWP
jgi:tripartite-type tricarboxylate transporter receptor subunit TctC